MNKFFMFAVLAAASFTNSFAQQEDADKYYLRNSLYMIKLDEPATNEEYANAYEIMNTTYDQIDFGKNYERYNDFALSLRHIAFEDLPTATQEEINAIGKQSAVDKAVDQYLKANGFKKPTSLNEYEYAARLGKYLAQAGIAQRLVAKWYNVPGTSEDSVKFDDQLQTITDLGLKGLSEEAKTAAGADNILTMAKGSTNKLLENCYVCVNRYNYISADEYKGVTLAAANLAANFMPGIAKTIFLKGTEIAVAKIKGYFVKVNSYLFQLDWNDALREKVETTYWKDEATQQGLLKDDSFKLKYVGKSSKNAPAALTFKTSALDKLIARGTIRATDRAFAALQRDNEEFRPMASLHEVDGKLVAYIGMKEDIKSGDKFNVYKPEMNPDGQTVKEWKNVGVIKVNKGCVWDNRAGAGEVIEGEASDKKDKDDEEGGKAQYTEFKEKPSKSIYGGLMIRLTK